MRIDRALKNLMFIAALAVSSSPACANDEVLRDGWLVQSSAKVTGGGEKVSQREFNTTGWYKTSVPNTVFAVLVENGVYKNPYFGMNLRLVPGVEYAIGTEFSNQDMPQSSPYAVPWWYRKEFEVPKDFKGKTVWMGFRGINYRAEIWINGKKVAGSDEIVGAYRRYEFDVTPFVHADEKNVVAVAVSAPQAGDLAITFVDWNPAPPDKDMGLWQEVVLSESGPVSVRHAFVESKLDLPSRDAAHLAVRAELHNTSHEAVRGTLRGRIDGAASPIEFSLAVDLGAGQQKEALIAPETATALNVKNPRLWWPYQMGAPYLHKLTLEFVTAKNFVSDTQTIFFGIAQTDSEMTPEGHKLLKVNGKPVLVRGGGWAPDMLLRVDESRREAEFRYVKEMGLNTIRLEGKLENEVFLDRADRDGILLMAGWCCCDAWEKWGKWSEENKRVSVDSLHDQLLRLRRHPSILVWLNGSDNPPPADREQAYLNMEKQVNWPKPVLSSAAGKKAEVSGESGVKMSGPYEYVSPNYWTLDTKAGGAYGFNTETSPGPAVPPIEGLKSFLPEDKLWPINDFWAYHAGGGQFKNISVFTNALEGRYGKAKDLSDFTWKSQAMTYEGQRAMFEAYGGGKYKSTGIIQWMLNNAWPSLIWHLYDYELRPAGGYFGTKKALELVHPQFSYADRTVVVVNGKQEPQNGLKIVAKVYDLSMKELFSREANLDVAADGVTRSFAIPEPAGATSTYFLNLRLYGSGGELLSRNFYWLSKKPDELNFEKTEWFFTPITSYADLAGLSELPKANVKASMNLQDSGDETVARVSVQNPGTDLAFLVRLRLLKGKDGAEVLPVFFDDNYLSLLPGEKREIVIHARKKDLDGVKPVLALDGFNVALTTVQ